MSDVAILLGAIQRGNPSAAEELFPLVYSELRRIAATKMTGEKAGQTLQPTALVHEAWLRLSKAHFENRGHFFAAAAEAMRRILVERARNKRREKRGGGAEHLDVAKINVIAPEANRDELLAVHEALDNLASEEPRMAELVKLRYFVGYSFEEAAAILGISVPTAHRDWAYARAWLHGEITRQNAE